MNLFFISELKPELKLYLLIVVPIASLSLWALLRILRKLVNKQVDENVMKFAKEAKIPKFLWRRIGVKINWR